MNEKIFLEELHTAAQYREKLAEKIKSHNLPVIIFGAAEKAKQVTEDLNNFGIKVSGYAVDGKYYKPNQTYLGLPVFNFDELRKTPEKYVFILGIGSKVKQGKRFAEFLSDKSITSFVFTMMLAEPVDYNFIADNKEKFVETYNLLADDFSKKSMTNYLSAHITCNPKYLEEIFDPDEYFNDLTRNHIQGGGHWIC